MNAHKRASKNQQPFKAHKMREMEETQDISHLTIKERASIFTSWKHIESLQILCNEIEESSENHKEIRTKFDLLLSICGMDIMLGGTIFKSYIEYEFDELADAIETNASDTIIKELKQYIIQLIHRQLSLPLIGNEIALQSYSQLLSEYYNENDEKIINPQKLLIKYNEGIDKRAARLVYEDKLYPTTTSDSTDNDTTATTYNDSNTHNIDVWRAYIKFEMSDNEYSRVQRLYERATGELSTRPPSDVISSNSGGSNSTSSNEVYTLWSEYINFAVYTIKNWFLVEEVTTKALRITINRTDVYLWKYHLYSLEKNGHNYDRVYDAIQQAMTVTFPSADSYLDLQCHLADYCSRRLTARQVSLLHTTTTTPTTANNNSANNTYNSNDMNDDAVLIEQARNALVLIETLLTTYYPDWAAGWLRYYKYTIHINNLILHLQHEYIQQYHYALTDNSNNTIKLYTPIKTIYEQALLKFGIYSYIWMEFTTWLKGLYMYDLCRKVYKRGIAAVGTTEGKVELAREWVFFEGMCGSIEDILQALKATKTLLAPSPSATTTTNSNNTSQAAPYSSSDKVEAFKKANSKTVSAPVKSILKPTSTTTTLSSTINNDSNSKRKQDQLTTTADVSHTGGSNESKAKRVRILEEESQNYDRLLIRNLPFTASIQDIHDFLLASAPSLSTFLAASRLDLVLSKAGKSRGLIVVNPPSTLPPTTTEGIYTDSANNNTGTMTTDNTAATGDGESRVNGGERGGIEGLLALNGIEYNGRGLVIERLTPTLTEAHGIHFHTPLIPSSHTTTASTTDAHTPTISDTSTHTTPTSVPAAGVAVAMTKHNSAQHPTTVFVSKLPKDYTNDQLYTLFAQCGPIVAAKITRDKKTGESKVSQNYNLFHC